MILDCKFTHGKTQFPHTRIKISQKETFLSPVITAKLLQCDFCWDMTGHNVAHEDWDPAMISCNIHLFFCNIDLIITQVFKILK
jgi:hypothetical protein